MVVSDGGLNDLDLDHARFLGLVTQETATLLGLAVGNDANVPLLETLVLSTDLAAVDRRNPEIRRMWAEQRVKDLLQGMRAGRLPRSEERTVVALGEAHSIVTPLTSFLALETDEMYEQYGIERRSHALLETERQAREERARRVEAAPPHSLKAGRSTSARGRSISSCSRSCSSCCPAPAFINCGHPDRGSPAGAWPGGLGVSAAPPP